MLGTLQMARNICHDFIARIIINDNTLQNGSKEKEALQKYVPISTDHVCGIITHAMPGSDIVATLKNIPIISITTERYFVPWNSEMYDISTANGPHILKMTHKANRKRNVWFKRNYINPPRYLKTIRVQTFWVREHISTQTASSKYP